MTKYDSFFYIVGGVFMMSSVQASLFLCVVWGGIGSPMLETYPGEAAETQTILRR